MTYAIDGAQLVAQIRHDVELIAEAVERFGTASRVTHCGDWCVGDVVRHLGVIHRWASEIVRTGLRGDRITAAPDRDAAMADWLRDGADRLCLALMEVSGSAGRGDARLIGDDRRHSLIKIAAKFSLST